MAVTIEELVLKSPRIVNAWREASQKLEKTLWNNSETQHGEITYAAAIQEFAQRMAALGFPESSYSLVKNKDYYHIMSMPERIEIHTTEGLCLISPQQPERGVRKATTLPQALCRLAEALNLPAPYITTKIADI